MIGVLEYLWGATAPSPQLVPGIQSNTTSECGTLLSKPGTGHHTSVLVSSGYSSVILLAEYAGMYVTADLRKL